MLVLFKVLGKHVPQNWYLITHHSRTTHMHRMQSAVHTYTHTHTHIHSQLILFLASTLNRIQRERERESELNLLVPETLNPQPCTLYPISHHLHPVHSEHVFFLPRGWRKRESERERLH